MDRCALFPKEKLPQQLADVCCQLLFISCIEFKWMCVAQDELNTFSYSILVLFAILLFKFGLVWFGLVRMLIYAMNGILFRMLYTQQPQLSKKTDITGACILINNSILNHFFYIQHQVMIKIPFWWLEHTMMIWEKKHITKCHNLANLYRIAVCNRKLHIRHWNTHSDS